MSQPRHRVAELAGVALPDPVNGRSLAPFLNGDTPTDWRDELLIENYTYKTEKHNAIRTSRFVYVEYKTGEREFYDLLVDPYQLNSQHNNPTFAGLIGSLATKLHALVES